MRIYSPKTARTPQSTIARNAGLQTLMSLTARCRFAIYVVKVLEETVLGVALKFRSMSTVQTLKICADGARI